MMELVVALGLLSLLLVGSLQVLAYLLVSNNKNGSALVGSACAQQKLEEVITAGSFTGGSGTLAAYTVDASTRTPFYFRASSAPLPGDLSSVNAKYLGGYLVTVDVWWNAAQPDQLRGGRGLQTVQAQRFVYPRVLVP